MEISPATTQLVDQTHCNGYALVTPVGDIEANLRRLEDLFEMLGEPIKVFRRHPFWKQLVADPGRPSTRSGGTGLSSLHIDCVNVEAGLIGPGDPPYAALLEFDRVLMSRTVKLTLQIGEALVIDQRKIVHGRLPLSPGQEDVPVERRRLLIQAYCKDGHK
jgi:hypothetical protein